MSRANRLLIAPALVACLLAVGAGPVVADVEIGPAEGLIVPGVGEMNVEGYTVFRDDQGSMYLKKGDRVLKPQAGDTVKHSGASEVQPVENNENANAALRDFSTGFVNSGPPVQNAMIDVELVALSLQSINPGGVPIPVLSDILDDIDALAPPLFGDTPFDNLGFFDVFFDINSLFVISSATADGLTPALFRLPVGSWLEFTPSATLRVIDVADAPAQPGTGDGSHHVFYAATVPEPGVLAMLTLGLAGLGLAGLACRRRASG